MIKVPNESITSEEFRMLLHCYRAGDASALSPLVTGMLRRIQRAAWPWYRVVDCDDLLQEGVRALLEYLPRLRLEAGASPINYVMLRIRSDLRGYIPKACPVTQPRGFSGRTAKVIVLAQGVSLGGAGDSERVLYG